MFSVLPPQLLAQYTTALLGSGDERQYGAMSFICGVGKGVMVQDDPCGGAVEPRAALCWNSVLGVVGIGIPFCEPYKGSKRERKSRMVGNVSMPW